METANYSKKENFNLKTLTIIKFNCSEPHFFLFFEKMMLLYKFACFFGDQVTLESSDDTISARFV